MINPNRRVYGWGGKRWKEIINHFRAGMLLREGALGGVGGPMGDALGVSAGQTSDVPALQPAS